MQIVYSIGQLLKACLEQTDFHVVGLMQAAPRTPDRLARKCCASLLAAQFVASIDGENSLHTSLQILARYPSTLWFAPCLRRQRHFCSFERSFDYLT